jgi:hypothetical protein
MERKSRGVLDTPPARGMTTLDGVAWMAGSYADGSDAVLQTAMPGHDDGVARAHYAATYVGQDAARSARGHGLVFYPTG